MSAYSWYSQLIKPSWAPPAWLFSPVWTFLYVLIAISFGYVVYLFFTKRISFRILLPFLLNLFFNFVFTPIQFGLQNNYLASVDVILVLTTLIWGMKAIFPYKRWIVYVNIPYLSWILLATVLQLTITYLNR